MCGQVGIGEVVKKTKDTIILQDCLCVFSVEFSGI